MKSFLLLLFLAILSDTIAGAIGAFVLWRYRNGSSMARYLAVLLAGVSIEGGCELVASLFPHGSPGSAANIGWYLAGRTVRSATVWGFVIYILGTTRREKNGNHAKSTTVAG